MKKVAKPVADVMPLVWGALAGVYGVAGFLGVFRAHPPAPLPYRGLVFLGLTILLYEIGRAHV